MTMSEEPAPKHQPIEGNREFETALDAVIAAAQRELRVFDHTLSTGFNTPQRHDALRNFLSVSRGNRLRIVVHEPAHLDRNCPRLLNLLRSFSHSVTIHETQPQAKSVYDPFTVADDRHFVRRFHFDEMRGMFALNDPIGAHTLVERFEEIWEASQPAVTPTTLGL
jgi:hypothetical protein